jgi:hypothetical protein
MAQVDPWEKAADGERGMRLSLDAVHRKALSNIREFWIVLARKSRLLSDHALATQIETIRRDDPQWGALSRAARREVGRSRSMRERRCEPVRVGVEAFTKRAIACLLSHDGCGHTAQFKPGSRIAVLSHAQAIHRAVQSLIHIMGPSGGILRTLRIPMVHRCRN